MTSITLAARNTLAQDTELTALLGHSASWDTWIFADKPFATIENSKSCLIVITRGGVWSEMNEHNTMTFPKILVDIWADPSRNSNLSVKTFDADDKIDEIIPLIDRHFHTVNLDVPFGMPSSYGTPGSIRMWGTAAEIAARTGFPVLGSQRLEGPDYNDVKDSTGTRMARLGYGVESF